MIHTNFSPIDVLRTTARKKAEEVIKSETIISLKNQIFLAHGGLPKGENFQGPKIFIKN